MPKAKKLPSGSYRVQASIMIDGKLVRKSFTDTSEKKAELKALQWLEYSKEEIINVENKTLKKAIEDYIKLKDGILSPSTIRAYTAIKNNNITLIKNIKLENLTANKIQLQINELAKTKSPKTVRNIHGLIMVAIQQYAPNKQIGKISLPQKIKSTPKALSQEDIRKMLNGIDDDIMEIPILLGLWLGMRRSEICAIEWTDIDFEKKTITINKAIVRDSKGDYVVKGTKTTDSTRVLQLPQYIIEKFKPIRKEKGRVVEISPNTITKYFPEICDKVGIQRYKFHDLRRSMATVGLSLNIADKIMMSIGGWNNPQTMKNIYQVVLSNEQENANNMLNEYFQNLIN